MVITVLSFKGGVGKTSISGNFALTEDFAIVTNDIYSPLKKILDKRKFIKVLPGKPFPKIPADFDVIYDLGGYLDNRVVGILKSSKWVLVPVINDILSIQVTIDAIREIEKYTKQILIVVNKAEKGDYDTIKEILSDFFPYPLKELKQSKSFPNVFKYGKSIAAMVAEGGLKKYSYSTVDKQFNSLIEYVKY